MKKLIYILPILVLLGIASCSGPVSYYNNEIARAEKLLSVNPDSAFVILDAIDPSDLREDSLRAKFIFLKAWGHMRCNRSMIEDSLMYFARDYYRGKDIVKDIRSSTALAFYKFWVGDTPGSIAMLDSLTKLPDVPQRNHAFKQST